MYGSFSTMIKGIIGLPLLTGYSTTIKGIIVLPLLTG